jgi:hypothetical protein
MSDRYKGAILSGTAPTVTQQSANGVYTLSQELQYQGQGVWPAAAQTPILKSLRFRSSASAYLNRTPASASNRKTWTWSGWVKRSNIGSSGTLFGGGTSGSNYGQIYFAGNALNFYNATGNEQLITTALYRDPSAWYHIVVAIDTTQATASNRIKFYVNGVQQTSFATANYPSQNADLYINSSNIHSIGSLYYTAGNTDYFDGYLGEVNFVDGVQLTPSSFGTTDANGIWQPIPYTGTYGTNGYYLKFNNTTSTATLGNDSSGNSNTWTVNNISLTSGTTYDSMLDSPSNASSTIANYCTLNPLDQGGSSSASSGNLQFNSTSSDLFAGMRSTIGVTTGKWYFEAIPTTFGVGAPDKIVRIGVVDTKYNIDANGGDTASYNSGAVWDSRDNGAAAYLYTNASSNSYAYSFTVNDVVMVAFDADTGAIWFGKNGTWNTGSPSAGTSPAYTMPLGYTFTPFADGANSTVTQYNFGQQPFVYTPPTGFNRLNTYNLPVPTIPAGNTVMDTTLYTGTGSAQSITNTAGFKPDFVWMKCRSAATSHIDQDSLRGTGNVLVINGTAGDQAISTYLTAFNSNGFSVGNGSGADVNDINGSGKTYVGWQWQAGQGVTSSNTNGTITSTVSANPAAGFSIVTYTGNLTTTGTATVGHGLGVAPQMIIFKGRNATTSWPVFHTGLSSWYYCCILDGTNAQIDQSGNGTLNPPTSTVFSTNWTTGMNTNGTTEVAYCFAPVAGYSAFGSYTGNGSSDGPFVYTGFRPRWIMFKMSSSSGNGWIIYDTARNTYNVAGASLFANYSTAENGTSLSNENTVDLLSNGFKLRTTNAGNNTNGSTYIYACFAENPFKIARAR